MPADLKVGILIPRGGRSTNDVLGICEAGKGPALQTLERRRKRNCAVLSPKREATTISLVNYKESHAHILDGPFFTTKRLDLSGIESYMEIAKGRLQRAVSKGFRSRCISGLQRAKRSF